MIFTCADWVAIKILWHVLLVSAWCAHKFGWIYSVHGWSRIVSLPDLFLSHRLLPDIVALKWNTSSKRSGGSQLWETRERMISLKLLDSLRSICCNDQSQRFTNARHVFVRKFFLKFFITVDRDHIAISICVEELERSRESLPWEGFLDDIGNQIFIVCYRGRHFFGLFVEGDLKSVHIFIILSYI